MGVDRILSTAGIEPVSAMKLRSYCNLMRSSLKDNWLFADEFVDCHVCFVSDDYIQNMPEVNREKAQVLVVVVKHDYTRLDDADYPYQLSLPINASKVRGVLNIISRENVFLPLNEEKNETKGSEVFPDENSTVVNRFKNAFNKIRSNFFGNKGVQMVQVEQDRKKQFISRITKRIHVNPQKNHRVVLLGSPGAGKTTAVQACSSGTSLSSEVSATDSIARDKAKTTVGIDYAKIRLRHGKDIQLFGTPGQIKFNFLWDVVGKSADAFIILLDLSRPDPLQYLKFYKRFLLSEIGACENIYCAFTHCDEYEGDVIGLRQIIERDFKRVKETYNIDARDKDDILVILEDISVNFESQGKQKVLENVRENSLINSH